MVRLKVKEIARQKGISMGKLSRASDPTLEKLAKVLGVSTSELIEDVPDDQQQ